MQTTVLRMAAVAFACAFAAGCSRAADPAKPVATPAVTVATRAVQIGSPVDLAYRFAVAADAPAFADDYTVFVHVLDKDRGLLWTDDHQPPTPTRQWKAGQPIEYTRTTFVPKVPYNGDATIEIGLYSAKDGSRLPLGGQDMGMRSYRVADVTIGPATNNAFVIFKSGWHNPELAEGASGMEWQWSRQAGVVSFRNPKRNVTLLVHLDQPVKPFADAQQVEIKVGDAVVDTFSLAAGQEQLRRVKLTAEQLGTGDTTDVMIAVDKTFVPAAVPGLKSGDARELGVRVFHVFVQPE